MLPICSLSFLAVHESTPSWEQDLLTQSSNTEGIQICTRHWDACYLWFEPLFSNVLHLRFDSVSLWHSVRVTTTSFYTIALPGSQCLYNFVRKPPLRFFTVIIFNECIASLTFPSNNTRIVILVSWPVYLDASPNLHVFGASTIDACWDRFVSFRNTILSLSLVHQWRWRLEIAGSTSSLLASLPSASPSLSLPDTSVSASFVWYCLCCLREPSRKLNRHFGSYFPEMSYY